MAAQEVAVAGAAEPAVASAETHTLRTADPRPAAGIWIRICSVFADAPPQFAQATHDRNRAGDVADGKPCGPNPHIPQ
jgi:hypothetical protein